MGTRGQLDTDHFARLIQRYGETPLRYLKHIGPCPNDHNNVLTGFQPDAACVVCGGVGEVFRELDIEAIAAASRAEGKVVLQGATSSRQRQPLTKDLTSGFASFLPGDYPMAAGDRLMFDSRDRFHSETFVWDEERTGALFYRLKYWPVLEVFAVYTGDGEIETGFEIGADERTIELTGVAAGTQVLVNYRYRTQWVVSANGAVDRVPATNGDRFPNRVNLLRWQHNDLDAKPEDLL